MEGREAVHRMLCCVCWILPSLDQNPFKSLGEKKQCGVFPVEPQMAGGYSAFRSYVAAVIWVLRWETCAGEVRLQLGCCMVGQCWCSSRSPNILKTVQDSSALKLLPHITCSVRWFNIWKALGILHVWWLHRGLWEVWLWCTHIKEKNGAVQPVLGSMDKHPCSLLVGFCCSLVGRYFQNYFFQHSFQYKPTHIFFSL